MPPLSAPACLRRLTAFLAVSLFALPFTASADQPELKKTPDPLAIKAPAEACALLDVPNVRARMDGLLRQLLVACGREDELGQIFQEPGFDYRLGREGDPQRGADGAVDVAVNDPSGDTEASSHTQSETSVAYNPITGTLCSGYNDSYHNFADSTGFTGFSRSTDNGATFTDQGALGPGTGGDPSIVWRRLDEKFYFAVLHSNGLEIYRSDDDCQTFVDVGPIHTGFSDDKELIAVDNTPASSFYGRIYNVWTDFTDSRIYSTHSSDAGATWSTPVALSAASADVQGAWPAVAPNGDVFVGWVRWNPFPSGNIDIEIVRSTDGGVSYTPVTNPMTNQVNPRESSSTSACGRPAINGNIRYLPSPQMVVDSTGVLHVVYSYDPDGFNTGDVIDVFYRRSTDSGATWGPEVKINDDATTNDQYFPSLSVGDTGIVSVAWYDRRLDPSNLLIDYYSRLSFDGGLTFEPSTRISDVSSPVFLDSQLASCYHGDYDQQVQTPSKAVLVWGDDRNMQDGHNDPDIFSGGVPLSTDFLVTASPSSVAVCAPDDAIYAINVPQFEGFTEPVTLSTSGLAAGLSGAFTTNPVTPPGTSQLTVSGTGGVAAGSYTFDIIGTSSPSAIVHETSARVEVFDQAPPAPALVAPADAATDQILLPTLEWSSAAQATEYTLEVASDPGFSSIVESANVTDTSYDMTVVLSPVTTYYWRVTGTNLCGTGTTSAVRSFTTRPIPPILLVDDDDNSPDVRTTITDTFDSLGLSYDLWDTANSDDEPSAAELAPYSVVFWFSGDEFGGFAGPGADGGAALETWLTGTGNCALLSSQDYIFDRGVTTFLTDLFGVGDAENDTNHNNATGQNTFAGFGPYALSYPGSNFADSLTPSAAAQTSFLGDDAEVSATSLDAGFRTVFLAFPFEALPNPTAREDILEAFLEFCDQSMFTDGFESGDTSAWGVTSP